MPVDCVVLPGMIHACIHMGAVTPAACQVFDMAGAWIRGVFQRGAHGTTGMYGLTAARDREDRRVLSGFDELPVSPATQSTY
ncbi:MAG: hypothetical protein ACN6QT_22725 [Burkholderia contaminans]|uniref:Esterase n=1 Tax=Burkholderia contaminans TaxID=488447 RepID=A0AAP4R2G5_9BURK|nr:MULTISPECIES: hypothetical protein [Burkholderia]MBD1411846.1 hypothetical protein [Burkholderia contaminans]MBH9671110.1 hypothetical protein [Burkholderia contaminans]MBH9677956.1 hypothetical protein [Burkholderia contaminans]MBH9708380.1 hypothetical protein [Burkholderia contaminans]MBH9722394.1 hypothetical protein [Burkholderia contaminans]